MPSLDAELRDALQLIQLLAVFVFAVLALAYPVVTEERRREIPSGEVALKQYLWHALGVVSLWVIPLLFLQVVLAFVLFPLFLTIVRTSTFNLFSFDRVRTLFVALYLYIFLLTALVGKMAFDVGCKIKKARQKLSNEKSRSAK